MRYVNYDYARDLDKRYLQLVMYLNCPKHW